MRLNQIQFLVELNKQKTFSKVADKLLISQPSISRSIKELEEELGYTIVKRTNKGVIFTEQGELVLKNAVAIMKNVENIMQTKGIVNCKLNGRVNIGGAFFFFDVIGDFLVDLGKKYPKISINLKEERTHDLINLVIDDTLDFGVILMYDSDKADTLNKIIKNELKYYALFKDDVCFCVRPDHPLLSKGNITINDILNYQYITFADKKVWEYTLILFRKFGYDKEIIEIRNRSILRKFVLDSDAITAMPHKLYNAIEKNYLKTVPMFDFCWPCEFGIIHKEEKCSIIGQTIINELDQECQRFRA